MRAITISRNNKHSNAIVRKQPINMELANNWLMFLARKAEATRNTYTKAIRLFMDYLADNNITAPTREDVEAYLSVIEKGGYYDRRTGALRQRKPSTVQSYLAAIKVFFNWTEETGIYKNIAKNIQGVRLDKEYKKDYLTLDEAKQLLQTIDTSTLRGKRDYAIAALITTTGLRDIEIARADTKDLTTKAVEVEENGRKVERRATVLYIQGKGHRDRSQYVKIAEPVRAAIAAYITAKGAETEALFTSTAHRNTGGRMTACSVSRIIKEALDSAGLRDTEERRQRITSHSLRHTAATQALKHGADIIEVQKMLRHTSINTTMIYQHALDREASNAEGKVAAALFIE